MITQEQYRRVQVLHASGRTADEISAIVGVGRSTTYKIARGVYPTPPRTPRCGECRARLNTPGCRACQLKRRKTLAHFAPVPIPPGTPEGERNRLEMSLAGLLAPRIANYLDRVGIRTVNDVLHRTQPELLAIPGIGTESIKRILRALERLDFDTTKAWQALNKKIATVGSRQTT